MNKISGIIVLYNPDQEVIGNIESYINDLDILFAVDNSEEKHVDIIKIFLKNPKIYYIDNHGNKGIAHALNVGSKKATELGYQWLLTMDQDSKAIPDMLSQMTHYILTNPTSSVSIVTPFHANKYHRKSALPNMYSTVLTTMTSGNLLNLDVYQKGKGFATDFFIDYVDNEYCLRSDLLGYKIVQINHAVLEHNLGNLKRHRILWKQFYSTNHSPIRRYYITRNRLKIIELYQNDFPEYCNFEKSRFLVDFIIVLLYEKQKFAKFKMMVRGYMDYKRNIFGKYHD